LEHWVRRLEIDLGTDAGDAGKALASRYRSLSICLESMGPIFAGFGRYLSSRIDVVPEGLGEELARIDDAAAASSPADVREVFKQELDCSPEHAFARFDPDAFQSRLFWQAHHARLGATNVIVKFIHPEIGWQLDDAGLLPLLEASFAGCGLGALEWRDALADFERWLAAETTLDASVDTARRLDHDAQHFDVMAAPRIYAHLNSRHVAVYEGWHDLGGAPAPDLARALCTVWLKQSLLGSIYPVNPTR
jgi:predicted unusual protein kinase regulating ubiquinone biosynthesis (AarF/ABC1/UbiB family)